jgi:hypothetical protein
MLLLHLNSNEVSSIVLASELNNIVNNNSNNNNNNNNNNNGLLIIARNNIIGIIFGSLTCISLLTGLTVQIINKVNDYYTFLLVLFLLTTIYVFYEILRYFAIIELKKMHAEELFEISSLSMDLNLQSFSVKEFVKNQDNNIN